MTDKIDLSKLSLPFPAQDIEWRVSRAGTSGKGPWCKVLAYITARAIQSRLDEVCQPQNWVVESPKLLDITGKPAFAVGISIRVGVLGDEWEWITKWDVAEPTNIEPAKGGFSGAMKRAGAQWGIGRYLYHLDETYAETAEEDPKVRGWHWARMPKDKGGDPYYWKEPQLPGWALPKEPEHEVGQGDLNTLKQSWRAKFAADATDPASLLDGFGRFVTSVVGEFPHDDHTCWNQAVFEKCLECIANTDTAGDISPDVPFE